MDRRHFFDTVRKHFGRLSQSQVNGFNIVLDAIEGLPHRYKAYILATAWHEVNKTMQPIREVGRGKGKKYGVPINGRVYYGRGLVQLTWLDNYKRAGQKIGVDLVNNPDLALDPSIAAKILVLGMTEGWFTGKKLSDYFTATGTNPYNARRIVNGVDRASDIREYYLKFYDAVTSI